MARLLPTVDLHSLQLDPDRLLAAGGEGEIYPLPPDRVVKLYHRPTPEKRKKLEALAALKEQGVLPPALLAPESLVLDRSALVSGFTMARLPLHYEPIARLGRPPAAGQTGPELKVALRILRSVRDTLGQIHDAGLVVGDLNDRNIWFDPGRPGEIIWIDIDSFQFDGFPCPAAAVPFLDPSLYGITDFASRPVFSQASDRYAFTVLLVQTLLNVHPYGGVHPLYKTIQARAAAGLTILDPAVHYPTTARPLTILSPALRDLIQAVFREGKRPAVEASLLDDWANSTEHTGPSGPFPRPGPGAGESPDASLPDLRPYGELRATSRQPNGRWRAIVHREDQISLLAGGRGRVLDETPLFRSSTPGRFYFLPTGLVFETAGRDELLVFSLGNSRPRLVTRLTPSESTFPACAFACSPTALYRLAGGLILRGTLDGERWLEEAVGTAFRQSTCLWTAPDEDLVVALHRQLGQTTLWLRTSSGTAVEKNWPQIDTATPDHIRFQHDRLGGLIRCQVSLPGRPPAELVLPIPG